MSIRIPLTLLTGVTLVVLVVGTVPAAPVPKVQKQPTDQEVRAKVFGTCWYETEKIVAGKLWPKHRYDPEGWKFTKGGGGELGTRWRNVAGRLQRRDQDQCERRTLADGHLQQGER